MALTTVFLLVLVVALVIGNALLFLFDDRKKKDGIVSLVNTTDGAHDTVSSKTGRYVQGNERASGVSPLEKKVELAHMRIQDLEGKFGNGSSAKVDESMRRKVEKLDNFRSTVESEIIGIKEILREIQGSNITVKARSFRNTSKGKRLSPKELHNLVYRAASK